MTDGEQTEADRKSQLLAALVQALALGAFFLGYLLTFWLTPAKVNAEFMSTAAQVIPVILLTLTIETRVLVARRGSSLGIGGDLRRRSRRVVSTLLTLWPLMILTAGVTLVWAEIIALASVNGNVTDGNGARVVFAAMVGGFVAVLIGGVVPRDN